MSAKLVLDTSVWLTYASFDKTHRLVDAVARYNLTIYVSDDLVAELYRNLPKVIQVASLTPQNVIDVILNTCIIVNPISDFNRSPDPKDNFLFDLALQTGSEVIVTKETALLNFEESPVAVHDIKWFKETYPVPL